MLSTRRSVFAMPFAGPAALAVSLAFTACATKPEAQGPLRKEHVYALTEDMSLIRFNAGQPAKVLDHKPVTGLASGERLVGMDFRVARGVLYALSSAGRLYTLDTATGELKPVGPEVLTAPLQGNSIGMDFNPAVDRIRVITSSGQNLRAHPDTGAQIDSNPNHTGVQSDALPQFEPGDPHSGLRPILAAVAYSYNNENDKLTTMYVIERGKGSLVRQGSKEGVLPFVSPDTGRLTTIGALGTGPLMDAAFDLSDVDHTPLLAARTAADPRTRLYLVDLATGKATSLGVVGDGAPIVGLSIEP